MAGEGRNKVGVFDLPIDIPREGAAGKVAAGNFVQRVLDLLARDRVQLRYQTGDAGYFESSLDVVIVVLLADEGQQLVAGAVMTKLEICAIEDANPGQVNLYPEGSFYKAYQQSAWLLCTRVHPFKVNARPLKGLDGLLLSVGFPMSSLDKFSAGLTVAENPPCGAQVAILQ